MRFNKSLFVIPWEGKTGLGEMPDYPHTGIGYLSSYLLKNNVENEVLDMRLGYSINDLFEKIISFKPDLIAFTSMTYRVNIAYDLIKTIKEEYDLPIVIGGPHATIYRKEIFKECPIDYLINFEGEQTLLELCNGKETNMIEGLIYGEEGAIIENPNRSLVPNLDLIPFPKYEKFEINKYAYSHSYGGKGIPIVSSRGCPYKCNFCSVQYVIGKKYRMRSADNILQELKYWHEKGNTNFFFVDDNFTMSKERIMNLCKLIKREKMNDLTLSIPAGVRADKLDYELLKEMKDVGFWFMSFGVESGNNKILQEINKHETVQEIEESIKLAIGFGFEIGLFFIIGHPTETPQDFEDSLKLAKKYPVSSVNFYHAIPFPKTELYNWVKENNLFDGEFENKLRMSNFYNPGNNQPFFETSYFTTKQRMEAFEMAKSVEISVKRNYIEKKMRKRFGVFGIILAHVIYSNFLYRKIQRLYYNKLSRKIIDTIIKLFKLNIHQF